MKLEPKERENDLKNSFRLMNCIFDGIQTVHDWSFDSPFQFMDLNPRIVTPVGQSLKYFYGLY